MTCCALKHQFAGVEQGALPALQARMHHQLTAYELTELSLRPLVMTNSMQAQSATALRSCSPSSVFTESTTAASS